jgi:choline transporter-like protein 2/4/5
MEQQEKQYGEPLLYDPEFKGAKIERRSTDYKCFILFVVCFVIWMIIGIFAIFQGNLSVYTNELESLSHEIEQENKNDDVSEDLIHDLKTAWPTMIFGLGFGIVACLLFIAVMRWIAGVVAWASLIIFTGFFAVGAIVCIILYGKVEAANEDEKLPFLVGAGVLAIIFVILLLLITCFRRKITLSIEFIKEASKATNSNILVMFFPIVQSLIEVFIVIFTGYITLKLSTIGNAEYRVKMTREKSFDAGCTCNDITYYVNNTCNPEFFNKNCLTVCSYRRCSLATIENSFLIKFFMAYTTFEFLWVMFFITAFAEMVLAGVFAVWYWTMNKDNVPSGSFWDSFNRTVKFHLGTLAFGSLIITIIRIIRMIISSLRDSLKDSNSPFAKAALCCLDFIIASIEEFLKMINRRAYILTAVHGTDFVTSAKNAFYLVMRNLLGVIVLDNVTGMVFFVMELLISIGATACFYSALTLIHSGIILPGLWAFIYFIITMFISIMFFSVFDMAIDTLFLCFLEDLERNDGSPDKPYYMSDKLREILQKED